MKLDWDKTGERYFETGVDHGVIYTPGDVTGAVKSDVYGKNYAYGKGTAWNGLTSVVDSPSGADETALWADNIKYASLRAAEEYGITIEAYQSPAEFDACDGTAVPEGLTGVYIRQQKRQSFGFAYRTNVQNDTGTETDDGYKIHLCWGLTASPSEQTHDTVNDSPDGASLSWECTSNPVNVTGFKPTSSMVIDTTKLGEHADKLKDLEDILFGSDNGDPWLPMPDDIILCLTTGKSAVVSEE